MFVNYAMDEKSLLATQGSARITLITDRL
jgi:hypothetical protein